MSDPSRLAVLRTSESPLLRCLAGEASETPPIWLMRQAGRYLPEYRGIRAQVPSFLDFCFNSRLAAEATIQPIRRFGFDAAILFSDILVIPHALGQEVSFEVGEGPRLRPVRTASDLAALRTDSGLGRLSAVFETVERARAALPPATALMGFCGAPWTVASYMVAGQGTPDQRPARLLAYREPELFGRLMDLLVTASAAYLAGQVQAGADALQIFDSWSGVLPSAEFARWCIEPVCRLVADVRRACPATPILVFSRASSAHLLALMRACGPDAMGLDTAVDIRWAAEHIQPAAVVQGNLDPLCLLAGGRRLDEAINEIRSTFAAGPHVFNLGHGILPETPLAHVERLVRRVRT